MSSRALIMILFTSVSAWAQVTKSSAMVTVGGCGSGSATSAVDVYRPAGTAPFPVFAFGHGFQNNKDNAENLARALAGLGVLVVVPQFPNIISACGSDHARNGRVLLAAIDQQVTAGVADATRVGLGGHSAGGLSAMLAAAQRDVLAVVLHDPVDNSGLGAAAATIDTPTLLTFAEPAMCNQQGNAVPWFTTLTGPKGRLKVVNANHCDPQGPISGLCTIGCGGNAATNVQRGALFQRYAVEFMSHYLLGATSPCLADLAQAEIASGAVTQVDLRFGTCATTDAGVAVDAGVVVDAGVPVDAGVVVDAGVQVDAGVEADAGVQVDAGVAEDAGVEVDAGVVADAGTTSPSDGGAATEVEGPAAPQGCGCDAAPGALAVLGLLVLHRKRARR